MKILISLTIFAYLRMSHAFMDIDEFKSSNLLRCYDTNAQDSRRTSLRNINGQALPLPNSIETFISIVERYESMKPDVKVRELIGKLLKSFRIDDLHPDVDQEIALRDMEASSLHNRLKRAIFSLPDTLLYEFAEDDFTDDEKCALHFMLSHTVNDTRVDDRDAFLDDTNKVKQPREFGVVSLHSKSKHAFALGRVLLGIYAASFPFDTEDLTAILQRYKRNDDNLRNAKVNLVHAVTIADLITRLVVKDDTKILGNGEWTDVSCPLEYKLDDNTGGFITYSELRGAVDGLIIGLRMQENRLDFANYRLSQILRQYYGFSGLVDPERTRWCSREANFQKVQNIQEEIFQFIRLYRSRSDGGSSSVGLKTREKIDTTLNEIRNNIFRDVEREECSLSELSQERKYVSPRNIFAILDYSPSGLMKMDFQSEVIGNLSTDFDLRPRGNLMGVYSNLKALHQNTLDVIVKNSGIAGCPSCFAKYYARTGNKEDDAEVIRDLNDTLTTFDLEQEQLEESYPSQMKAGSPGKVILYFSFGSANVDYRLRDALWDLRRYYRSATIIAIGDSRETLTHFVENDDDDIYSSSPKTIQDLKQRINKVPGEFTYKYCNQSNSARELDNIQEAFISPNKIQYWAMYPKYFLKSYGLTLKFKAQEGTGIRVCFTRSYSSLIEGRIGDCKDSTGAEIEFWTSNPCHKKSVHNCRPFYFSVEGKKQPPNPCESLRCSTANDIQFTFVHEGISCNVASYASVSTLALLFAAILYHLQRQ